MSFIYRATAFIRRQKTKSIILFLILFVIGNITLAGLSVQKGSEDAQQSLIEKTASTVNYSLNQQLIMEQMRAGTLDRTTDTSSLTGIPTIGNYQTIASSSYLTSSDAIATYEVTSDTITPYVNQQNAASDANKNAQMPQNGTNGANNAPDGFVSGNYESAGDFTMNTFVNSEPTAFTNSEATLLSGRFATQDEIDSGANVVLIETNVATDNNLSVGDTITLTPTISGHETAQTYQIIGIYESQSLQDIRAQRQSSTSLLSQNQIYVPLNSLKTLGLSDTEFANYTLSSAVFNLINPNDADAFISEASAQIDLTYSTLAADTSAYDRVASSLSSISTMSTSLIYIVVGASAIILSLIVALSINQRKNEIGSLLALGEQKWRIITQFILEIACIAIVTFALSCLTFPWVAQKVTTLAASQKTQQTSQTMMGSQTPGNSTPSQTQDNFSQNTATNSDSTEVISSINTQLTPAVTLEFIGLGLALCIIATIIPSIIVMRYNPKKILSQE